MKHHTLYRHYNAIDCDETKAQKISNIWKKAKENGWLVGRVILTSVDLAAYLKYNAEDDLGMDKPTLVQSVYVFVLTMRKKKTFTFFSPPRKRSIWMRNAKKKEIQNKKALEEKKRERFTVFASIIQCEFLVRVVFGGKVIAVINDCAMIVVFAFVASYVFLFKHRCCGRCNHR